MSDEMTFTLHNPLTEEEWDMITDVDLDHTPAITFHTKHGKEVVFVKRKTGRWIDDGTYGDYHPHHAWHCSECQESVIEIGTPWFKFCPNCGAKMDGSELK